MVYIVCMECVVCYSMAWHGLVWYGMGVCKVHVCLCTYAYVARCGGICTHGETHPSVRPSVRPPARPPARHRPSIHPSIHPSVHPYILICLLPSPSLPPSLPGLLPSLAHFQMCTLVPPCAGKTVKALNADAELKRGPLAFEGLVACRVQSR